MYCVYMAQSMTLKQFYIGVTSNLEERMRKHNAGSSSYTKPYRPWKLIYSESFVTKTEAYKREYFLKHPGGFLEKKKIIAEHQF